MKKNIFIIILIIVIITLGFYFIFIFGDAVDTEEEAIQIAETYVYKKYNENFDEYLIEVSSEDKIWIVYYVKIDEHGDAYEGGGGPEVHIKKSNGRITKCYLQK